MIRNGNSMTNNNNNNNLTRTRMENILQFCFASFFTFDQRLVVRQTEFSSSEERDNTAEPIPLPYDTLPSWRVDPNSLPSTALIYGQNSSIYGELHPHLLLLVNFATAYEQLNHEQRLVLTHHFGLKRTFVEIGQTLGREKQTVRKIINGAIDQFIPVFTDLDPTSQVSCSELALMAFASY